MQSILYKIMKDRLYAHGVSLILDPNKEYSSSELFQYDFKILNDVDQVKFCQEEEEIRDLINTANNTPCLDRKVFYVFCSGVGKEKTGKMKVLII